MTETCKPGRLLLTCRAFSVSAPGKVLYAATAKALRESDATECRRFCALHGGPNSTDASSDEAAWWACEAHGTSEPGPTTLPMNDVIEIVRQNCMHLVTEDEGVARSEREIHGVFLLGTMANHSCHPSAARHFLGDSLWLRAARRLEIGEEVTISYTLLNASVAERRRVLAGYGFECQCLRCRLEDCALPERPLRTPAHMTVAGAVHKAASVAERAVLAKAPPDLLEETHACGLNVRGCFLAIYIDDLLLRMGSLRSSDPEAFEIAVLFEEAIAAVQPNSSTHSWCCSTLLIAAGVAASSHRGDPTRAAIAVAAAVHACDVHTICYGGGDALWKERLKGGAAARYVGFQSLPCPIDLVRPTPWCIPRLTDAGPVVEVELTLPSASRAPHVDISEREVRVSIGVGGVALTRVSLDPGWIDAEGASGRWARQRRRLMLILPMRRKGSV